MIDFKKAFQDVVMPELRTIEGKFEAVNAKLDSINIRIDEMDKRLDSKINEMDKRLSSKIEELDKRLSSKIDGLEKDINRVEHRVEEIRDDFRLALQFQERLSAIEHKIGLSH